MRLTPADKDSSDLPLEASVGVNKAPEDCYSGLCPLGRLSGQIIEWLNISLGHVFEDCTKGSSPDF